MFTKKNLRAHRINFMGARGTLTTLYQALCILLFGCLLALYVCIQLGCVVVLGPFFLLRPDQFYLLLLGYCEVKIGPSDRKKKKKKQLIGVWL